MSFELIPDSYCFEVTHIPPEIIEEEITKWLNYKTKHTMATVCSRFSAVWKSWVRILPYHIMMKCDDDRLVGFSSLRKLRLGCNQKITNKSLEQLHKLEQLDVGEAYVDPCTSAILTIWGSPTTPLCLKIIRVSCYLFRIEHERRKEDKCLIFVELLEYLANREVAKTLRNKNLYKTIIDKIDEQEYHLEGKAADSISKIRELYRYE